VTAMLPILEPLSEAIDDRTRAQWLLRLPEAVMSREQLAIHALLEAANFQAGIEALNAEVAASSAVRDIDGSIPQSRRMAREHARIGLKIIARGGCGTRGLKNE